MTELVSTSPCGVATTCGLWVSAVAINGLRLMIVMGSEPEIPSVFSWALQMNLAHLCLIIRPRRIFNIFSFKTSSVWLAQVCIIVQRQLTICLSENVKVSGYRYKRVRTKPSDVYASAFLVSTVYLLAVVVNLIHW